MPERIQRKRTKGWRLPPNTVSVTRPGKWGNPFNSTAYTARESVELYRTAIMGAMPIAFAAGLIPKNVAIMEFAKARIDRLAALPLDELRGKNLACWCRIGEPCHADVLLALANAEETPTTEQAEDLLEKAQSALQEDRFKVGGSDETPR